MIVAYGNKVSAIILYDRYSVNCIKRFEMKNLMSVLLLILTGTVFASAQTPSTPSIPPDIKILHQKWRLDIRNPALDEDPFKASTEFQDALRTQRANDMQNPIRVKGSQPRETPPPRPNKNHSDDPNPSATYTPSAAYTPSAIYTYTAEIKNTGVKATHEVEWGYVFIDPDTQIELGSHHQLSKIKIRPGQNKILMGHSTSPPTNTISARNAGKELSKRILEQIVIYRVEYDDGSVWENPTRKRR